MKTTGLVKGFAIVGNLEQCRPEALSPIGPAPVITSIRSSQLGARLKRVVNARFL
jgi:hypothetical protein